jgi:uncharacterized membrane protein
MYGKTRIDLPITSSFYVMAIHTVQDQIIKRIQKYILVDEERTTTETMFVCLFVFTIAIKYEYVSFS